MPASTGAAATGFGTRELQQVVRDAELGRRYADKLAEVHTLDGAETWVLVHIEIQGQVSSDNYFGRLTTTILAGCP